MSKSFVFKTEIEDKNFNCQLCQLETKCLAYIWTEFELLPKAYGKMAEGGWIAAKKLNNKIKYSQL